MSRHAHILNQTGDTIVEVLLAIAVVSAVLGGAFVSTNNSFRGTQRSQERAEAMKLLEGQLELLKEASKSPTTTVFGPSGPNPFCLDNTLNQIAPCQQGTDNRYNLSIQRSGSETFTARATWDRLGGGGQDQVTLMYRLYDEN